MIYQGSGRTPVTEVIIHCAATRPTGWFADLPFDEQVKEIRRWHVTPKVHAPLRTPILVVLASVEVDKQDPPSVGEGNGNRLVAGTCKDK